MKSFYTSKALILIMALTFWACSDDIDNPNNKNRNASGTSNRFSVTVGMPDATQESLKSAQTTTKVNLANDASTPRNLYETWAEGDQIALFFINDDETIIAGKKVRISNISPDRKSCYFEGEIPEEVSTAFTLVGVVGIDDVKVSNDGTKIVASAEPRPFKANNDDDKIPMMFQYKVETRDASGTTTIQALFERVGSIEHVYFQNKSGVATTVQNVEMVPVKAGAPAWYHTAGTNQIPQVDLLTGDVATVPGTPKTSAMTATSVRSGATQSFIKWVMPIEDVQKPEVKIEVTTNSEKITSFNSNKIPDVSHNINVQKQRIYTEVVQLSTVNSRRILEFLHPYIIQTDGGASANAYIASLKGVKHMELEGNIHGFTGLTESKWFNGLTKVISYGNEIATLNYQNSTQFSIDAQLTPRITSLASTFKNAQSETYPGIEKWDTQYISDMTFTFQSASNFNQDISGWNVSNVTDMSAMFYGASKFNNGNQPLSWGNKTSLVADMQYMFVTASNFNQDISSWDVSNVTNMSAMFYGASKFNNGSQPLSWGNKTSKVTNMNRMFEGASNFNQDISSWDVSNVTDMQKMFYGASSFNNGATSNDQSKPLSWGKKTSKVTSMNRMFVNASNFNQDISGWDVSKVTTLDSMFYNAKAFNQDISGWDVSEVKGMKFMFHGASSFNNGATSNDQSKPLSWGEKTSKVTSMNRMFSAASNFNQDISEWNVSAVTDMTGMFKGASKFNQNISKWDLSNVENMAMMFAEATEFNNAKQPLNWGNKTKNVIDMEYMFAYASNFNQDISGWNVNRVLGMNGMFAFASVFNNNEQPLNWGDKTRNVRRMSQMFAFASNFNQDISGWNVSNVTDMSSMFRAALAFNNGATSNNQSKPLNWGDKTSNVTRMNRMFDGASNFNQDITNWDVSSVVYMDSMFYAAKVFDQNIKDWKVNKVTNMRYMFAIAEKFDQNISNWDVSNVTDMNRMFYGAYKFNQDISGWKISNVTDMTAMFYAAHAFNQNLSGWCVQKISTIPPGFDGSAFTENTTSKSQNPAGFYGNTTFYPKWGTCP